LFAGLRSRTGVRNRTEPEEIPPKHWRAERSKDRTNVTIR